MGQDACGQSSWWPPPTGKGCHCKQGSSHRGPLHCSEFLGSLVVSCFFLDDGRLTLLHKLVSGLCLQSSRTRGHSATPSQGWPILRGIENVTSTRKASRSLRLPSLMKPTLLWGAATYSLLSFGRHLVPQLGGSCCGHLPTLMP